jgi:SsrA-binding protein
MSKKNAKDSGSGKSVIATNRRASHDYHLVERFEAGLALQGWEVKALRAGRLSLGEGYAIVRNGELYLIGAQITPLITASTHVLADDRRSRKLLLHRHEIDKLVGKVERDGYTLVPLSMYWKNGRAKLELALAKGKQQHDKREAEKSRDFAREKQRAMRSHNRAA